MKQFIRVIPLFFFLASLQSMVEEYKFKAPRTFTESLVHIGPTMIPAELKNFAHKNGVVLPVTTFDFQQTYRYKDFNIFQDTYNTIFSVLKSEDDMAQTLLHYAKRSAAEGIKYMEIMVCASRIEQTMPTLGWQAALVRINSAAQQIEEKYGIIVTPLLTLLRGDSQAQCEKYTEFLVQECNRDLNLFGGLQVAGAEDQFPSVEPYRSSYDRVHKAGLGCAAHAGENGDAQNILAALSLPGITRISHGIACIKNVECIEALKKRDILVEVAVSSNICMETQNIKTFQEHPLRNILAALVKCHFTNSDNPLLCNTTANNEARIVRENFNLPLMAFMHSDINAMEHAFLPPLREHKRAEIIEAIQAYYYDK